MPQTEDSFLENHSDAVRIANAYMKSKNGQINNNFLKSCFMKIIINEKDDKEIILSIESNEELIFKTVLCFRGHIAAATNHAEGFHTQLKAIS